MNALFFCQCLERLRPDVAAHARIIKARGFLASVRLVGDMQDAACSPYTLRAMLPQSLPGNWVNTLLAHDLYEEAAVRVNRARYRELQTHVFACGLAEAFRPRRISQERRY